MYDLKKKLKRIFNNQLGHDLQSLNYTYRSTYLYVHYSSVQKIIERKEMRFTNISRKKNYKSNK